MIVLPNKEYDNSNNEKINTYQFLASVGCPVFKSVLFNDNEIITSENIVTSKQVLQSDYCTVRYQYIVPNFSPVRGGNKCKIDINELTSKQVAGTQMWLLQPIDRTKNFYGINMYVNKSRESLIFECVGRGFDVSDLNRGDITPHEIIHFQYPINYGWQLEWWKYITINFVNYEQFNEDKISRLNKLYGFGLKPTEAIFDKNFVPMSYELIEKLLMYFNYIDEKLIDEPEYTVSISVNEDNSLVFWDVQTPLGKMKILRR